MDYATKSLNEWQQKTIMEFSKNDMSKLRQMSDKLILKLGGVDDYLKDEFYSRANLELLKAVYDYDYEKCDKFDNYLKSNCERKFKTILRDMQRSIRCSKEYKMVDGNKVEINHKDKRLDAPVSEDGDTSMGETLKGSSLKELFDDQIIQDRACMEYISKLSKKQKIVLSALLRGYAKPKEICSYTGLKQNAIKDCMIALKDSNLTRFLYQQEVTKYE